MIELKLTKEELEKLDECLFDYDDLGPLGMGWPSEQLEDLRIKVFEALEDEYDN